MRLFCAVKCPRETDGRVGHFAVWPGSKILERPAGREEKRSDKAANL